MGNKKKQGRYSVYRKKSTAQMKTNKPRPTHTPEAVDKPIKTSSSKVKLQSNFDYYDSKIENLQYDIIDLSVFNNTLKDIAACNVCKGFLNLSKFMYYIYFFVFCFFPKLVFF